MTRPQKLVALTVLAACPLLAIAHEAWNAPDDAKTQKSPLKAGKATVDAGKKVYEARCLSCHGSLGKGDGRASAYMKVKPENLTEEDVQAETDGELFWKITTGRRPMPDFGGKLTDEERWQVVAYVRELANLGGESKEPDKK